MNNILSISTLFILLKTCNTIDEIPASPPPGESTSYVVPEWAPAGATAQTRYYYFPDYEMYYYVPTKLWVYNDGDIWVTARTRPSWSINVDLFSTRRMGLNYYGAWPWKQHSVYFNQYPPGAEFVGRWPSYKHPHGMPPGQAKKFWGSPGHDDKYNAPPGQVKKNFFQPGNPKPFQGSPKMNPAQHGNPAPHKLPVQSNPPGGNGSGQGGGHGKPKVN